jgi:hypothetical protein
MYVDHCWLSNARLVIATSDRQLQVVEATEVVQAHQLARSISGMLALPDNMLMVSMAKVGGWVAPGFGFYGQRGTSTPW